MTSFHYQDRGYIDTYIHIYCSLVKAYVIALSPVNYQLKHRCIPKVVQLPLSWQLSHKLFFTHTCGFPVPHSDFLAALLVRLKPKPIIGVQCHFYLLWNSVRYNATAAWEMTLITPQGVLGAYIIWSNGEAKMSRGTLELTVPGGEWPPQLFVDLDT